ncbi:hypothetical protein LTR62_003049 [Meristemomyces frigidus]|uniref:Uncharacterized protein n=1 Tax=Meristemomyces frigidus TaxID=1508187 RepID=A0AAN7TKG0_9PEZI|nr:hypothetical protein LTR62_003049 [Meristemomyces frigidus]
MARQRRPSTTSSRSSARGVPSGQEMASMYDYLAKIILLGPSGCGKSCLLHRFLKGEWRVLTSQTIGVEFASKIVKVGPPGRRKRVKLQLWDTAGTERFRSVSRSYYRGAAGAILVYDIANPSSFAQLQTFLNDARALASPHLTVLLVGNKEDLAHTDAQQDLLDDIPSNSTSVDPGTSDARLGSQLRATATPSGRAVPQSLAASWASQNRIPVNMEVSALSGEGVHDIFSRLASSILTKIELGEIDPNDPMSGIQYGDADYHRYDDGSSIRSGGLTSDGYVSTRKRRGRGGWSDVFNGGRRGNGGGGKCC